MNDQNDALVEVLLKTISICCPQLEKYMCDNS